MEEEEPIGVENKVVGLVELYGIGVRGGEVGHPADIFLSEGVEQQIEEESLL